MRECRTHQSSSADYPGRKQWFKRPLPSSSKHSFSLRSAIVDHTWVGELVNANGL